MKTKTTTETREALEKKCRLVKFGKDVIDHRADGYMSAPEKTIYGFEYDDIMQLIAKEKQDLLESLIERFGERYDEELERESKNQELDGASAFAEAIAITKTLATEKLAEMSKIQEGKGEK